MLKGLTSNKFQRNLELLQKSHGNLHGLYEAKDLTTPGLKRPQLQILQQG